MKEKPQLLPPGASSRTADFGVSEGQPVGQSHVHGDFSYGADEMKKHVWIGLAVAVLGFSAAGFWGYQRWHGQNRASRNDLLTLMPAEASAVLFADFAELRQAPFIAQLYAWAPKPQVEPEYAQFIKETGFDYEKDIARIAIAIFKNAKRNTFLAVVNGRFDQKKISAYALQRGKRNPTENNRTVFLVPLADASQTLQFMFLRADLLVITNDDLGNEKLHDVLNSSAGRAEWRARFEWLAGSPLFVVVRQDATLGSTLTAQAPGGLRSPQLSSLLDQLQWITLAGKQESDRLRVVAEGECTSESTARQLVDMMNGVVIFAQAGLNDAKTRQQLDPAARQAYLELLKNTEVSKIDRGDTNSVRVVFEITPEFLEAASHASPAVPESMPGNTPPGKSTTSKKGHT
jgi:hypothetical protein